MNSIIHGVYMDLLMSEKMDEKDQKNEQNNNDDKESEPLLGEDDS